MKLSIIVFRHGTIQSGKNIFCGWLNLPLSNLGETQARVLSQKLKGERIDYAFCSDLLRGKQALAAVLVHHPNAKVIIDHRLRERHYGKLTGKHKELLKQTSPKEFELLHRGVYHEVPGGENLFAVSKRVFPFMNDLLRFMQKEKCSVAISAHTNSFRSIQEYLEGQLPREASRSEHAPTEYKKYIIEFE